MFSIVAAQHFRSKAIGLGTVAGPRYRHAYRHANRGLGKGA